MGLERKRYFVQNPGFFKNGDFLLVYNVAQTFNNVFKASKRGIIGNFKCIDYIK